MDNEASRMAAENSMDTRSRFVMHNSPDVEDDQIGDESYQSIVQLDDPMDNADRMNMDHLM